MNDEVVNDAMRNLDLMSPPPKDLVLYSQPLAIREVIDLDSVHGDNNVQGGESNLNDSDINVGDDPLPQRRKGKARFRRSLEDSFDVGSHRGRRILGVRIRKGQARQGRAGRAQPQRTRRDPLWLDRGNHAELV